ncbi:MAG: hypothetical protein JRF50_17820 [Deltaproteobacteria bacterium]|nr:hypothetical protein [Deltaproteobacteria bacterium]
MNRSKLGYLLSGIVLVVALGVGLMLVSGCATAPPAGEGPVATIKGKAAGYSPTAEITSLKYLMKESKFHVKVGLKNISDKPKRFNLTIAIPKGPSAGGFYPIQKKKGKIPYMKPGEELVREFRMYYDKAPASVIIKVDEV